jgi:TPR repeat protein
MSEEERGVERNDVESARWHMKAAEQGEGIAQLRLGSMLYEGRGVPQNYTHAYAWASLAAASLPGNDVEKAAALRDQIAAKLTPDMIVEAQSLATLLKH